MPCGHIFASRQEEEDLGDCGSKHGGLVEKEDGERFAKCTQRTFQDRGRFNKLILVTGQLSGRKDIGQPLPGGQQINKIVGEGISRVLAGYGLTSTAALIPRD